MALIYLSLGSNVEAQRNIEAAMDALADTFGELIISSVYESEAVGLTATVFTTWLWVFTLTLALANCRKYSRQSKIGKVAIAVPLSSVRGAWT